MSRVFGGGRVLMAAAKTTTKAAKPSTTTTTTTTTTATAAVKASSSRSGILKPLPVSPAMQKFLGVSESSRTEATKKIWDYIKSNNLQNPYKKQIILCDEKLKTIFDGKDQVGILEIAKLISPHFIKQ